VTQNPCDRRSGNEIFVLLPLGGDRFMIETLPYHARCLEVPNGVATPAPLRSRECVRSVSQTFRWNPVGPPGRGTFVTETSHTAPFNCVGVVGASKADDAAVAQSPCSGGSSQLWDLVPWTAPA
jgi:hypothetical protein